MGLPRVRTERTPAKGARRIHVKKIEKTETFESQGPTYSIERAKIMFVSSGRKVRCSVNLVQATCGRSVPSY